MTLNIALIIKHRAAYSQFDCNNKPMLSTCLEEILKKDFTGCDSLRKLILLHRNGLHLDATTAEYDIWREYAMCFLKLSQYEEDRMSVCLNGDEGTVLRFFH